MTVILFRLDEITNNIWRTYYAERTINLAAITIISTFIFAFASIYTQKDSHSTQGIISIIPLISACLSGIDVVLIGRYFSHKNQVMNAIQKIIPFRFPLDEMLIKVMYGKYENTTQLQKEYEERLRPLNDVYREMEKKSGKKMLL